MRGSPPGLDDQAADPAVRGGEALRSQHCAARSAVQVWLRAAPRGEDLKEAGGRRPPASFKTSPLPRLDSLLETLTRAGRDPPLPALRCAQRGASAATGCCARVRGGGGGRKRPFGMLPWRGREAARRDHQPQLVYELMTRDTRRPGWPGSSATRWQSRARPTPPRSNVATGTAIRQGPQRRRR